MTPTLNRSTFVALILVLAMLLPVAFAQAQESALHATIRAQVLQDPRAATLSEAELEALITALAEGAEEQGMTVEEIEQRPLQPDGPALTSIEPEEIMQTCEGMPQFVCTVQSAFGFDGSNTIIPIGLLITSGLLWFLLYELKHHHKMGFK